MPVPPTKTSGVDSATPSAASRSTVRGVENLMVVQAVVRSATHSHQPNANLSWLWLIGLIPFSSFFADRWTRSAGLGHQIDCTRAKGTRRYSKVGIGTRAGGARSPSAISTGKMPVPPRRNLHLRYETTNRGASKSMFSTSTAR
jgi:hypothetical protein